MTVDFRIESCQLKDSQVIPDFSVCLLQYILTLPYKVYTVLQEDRRHDKCYHQSLYLIPFNNKCVF